MNKRPNFPEVLHFEKVKIMGGPCYWDYKGFRSPKRGEFYLSGANEHGHPDGWCAPNDLSIDFHVVRPTHHAERVWRYERGAAIKESTQ